MWILYLAIAVLAVYLVITYNSFVSLKNRARNAWSDIDVQLKRRYDLIPNLVEIVKGYASHEKGIFEDVARLRSNAMQAGETDSRSSAENQLTGAIKTLFAVAESYPNLKADANFRQLQAQLTEVEDNIQYSRRYYNAVVRDLNTKREIFPSSLIASWFGFGSMQYFQAGDEERNSVRIDMQGGQS